MSANNKCFFLGRFVADPELRYAGETAIARGRIAVSRRYKRDGDPDADFLNLVSFNKTAESISKYFQKGSLILVETHVQTGSYTNKDGQKRYTTDFVVDAWEFTGAKDENGSEAHSDAPKKESPKDGEFVSVPETTEDLPWD